MIFKNLSQMKIYSFPLVFVLLFPLFGISQTYGGSAYVRVIDDEGNTRVINAVCSTSIYYNATGAKTCLLNDLKGSLSLDEDFNGPVKYSI